MWPFGKRIENAFRTFYFLGAKVLIINYENLVRGKVIYLFEDYFRKKLS